MQANLDEAIETLKETSFSTNSLNNLFSSSPNYTALLKTNDTISKSVKLDKKERTFKSQELNYISTIFLYTDNIANARQAISLSYINANHVLVSPKIHATNNFAFVYIRDFVDKFEISFSGSGVRPKIQKITVNGIECKKLEQAKETIIEFFSASSTIDTIIKKHKADVLTAQQALEAITVDINKKEKEKEQSTEELGKVTTELDQISTQLKEQQSELAETINRLTSVSNDETTKHNNVVQLTEKEGLLNREIALLRSRLERLQYDKEIISDEFIDYVKEGKSQARTYLGAIVMSFFIIGLCVALLFNGASNLLSMTYQTTNDVFAALALRLPFASVLSMVIVGAAAFINYLIARAVHINEERLILAKLLVIAKDTTNSSMDKLELTDLQRLNARIRLKIDLLKAHLTAELGKSPRLKSFEPEDTTSSTEAPEKENKKEEPWL